MSMRMMDCVLPTVVVMALVANACPVRGADPRHPDWPCVQAKVPEVSVAAVWEGPPIDYVGRTWEEDPRVRELVPKLAARRTSLEEAAKTIADFVTGNSGEKEKKAKLLFAGLFATLNRERSTVMSGIERFARKQRELAETIRADIHRLRELQDKPDHDQKEVDDLSARIEWSTRIFEERRRTIGYVCEVPTLIEQRLFALSRAIQHALE
jgi:hypothetical protein